jgi:hypothetical protein
MNGIPGLCGDGNVVFSGAQEGEVVKTAVITLRIGKADDTGHAATVVFQIKCDLRVSGRLAELIRYVTGNECHRHEAKNQVFGREFLPGHDRRGKLFVLFVG